MDEPLSLLPSSASGGVPPTRRRRRHGVCHELGVPLPAALRLLQDLALTTAIRGSSYSNVATAVTSLQRRNAFRKISAPVRAGALLPHATAAVDGGANVQSTATTGDSLQLSSHRAALRRRQRRSSTTTTAIDRTLSFNDDESTRSRDASTRRNSYNGGSSSSSSLSKDISAKRRQPDTKWKVEFSASFDSCVSTSRRRRVSYPVLPRPGIRHCCRSRRWRRRSTSAAAAAVAAAFWILPRSSRHSLVPYRIYIYLT